ncbi:MAG: NUDIX hydrolase [Clostridia bacterium]
MDIADYVPFNEQEDVDKAAMLRYLSLFNNLFSRENTLAHFTASSWIVDKTHSRVLMAYHNIYHAWSWTGGHADGEHDLLGVALREAKEETGIRTIAPVINDIYSLEILGVDGHVKHGKYISAHLHLNVTYLLVADDTETLSVKPDENSGVRWFDIEKVVRASGEVCMASIYAKLNDKLAFYI